MMEYMEHLLFRKRLLNYKNARGIELLKYSWIRLMIKNMGRRRREGCKIHKKCARKREFRF